VRIAYLCLQATREGQASHAHAHEIIEGLRLRGHEVDLHEPAYSCAAPSILTRLREFASLERRLIRNLGAYDAVYLRAHPLAYPVARAARARATPVVQECNGTYRDLYLAWPVVRPIARVLDALQRRQYAWAAAVVAVTPELAEWVRAVAGVRETVVVPNGADTTRFTPEAAVATARPYALFFGALAPWQGIRTMLDAAESDAWPDGLDLRIVGDGRLRQEVEERSGRNPRIVYSGASAYSEMPRIVASSVCSLIIKDDPVHAAYGLSPLKLYESMASGVPVIVSHVAGLREAVADCRCGVTVTPGDPLALAAAVDRLWHDGTRDAMGRRGRESAVRDHSWRQRAKATAEVLERVVGSGEGVA
jgi:glycosyltransferase involved in cell wall biosynthesis